MMTAAKSLIIQLAVEACAVRLENAPYSLSPNGFPTGRLAHLLDPFTRGLSVKEVLCVKQQLTNQQLTKLLA